MRSLRHVLVATVLIGGPLAAALSAAVKVEEQVVGPKWDPAVPGYKVSDRGVHYAIVTMKGSRSLVVVDGVEGPLCDQVLSVAGEPTLTAQTAVVFSPTGEHHAYLSRTGNEFVVVRDGREYFRGPYWISALRYGELAFSPGGKHLHFTFAEQVPSGVKLHLVVDGKAGPDCLQYRPPVFSPDDSRWAHLARRAGTREDEWFVVVDGKETRAAATKLAFTSDNRLLAFAPATADGPARWLLEGKPVLKAAIASDALWVADQGGRYALAAQEKAGAPMTLFVDGQPVAGATDPQKVVFSPDGRRYQAVCRTTTGASFVVTDGKAGREYQGVAEVRFTPDSRKAIAVVHAGGKSFVVVDGVESDGFGMLAGQTRGLVLSERGGRYGYGTLNGMNNTFSAVVDGKQVLAPGRRVAGDSWVFSPDGQRYVFGTLPAARNDDASLVIDGTDVAGIEPVPFPLTQFEPGSYAIFSPDGKHVAWRGRSKTDPRRAGLVLDEQLVHLGTNMIRRPTFTPDGRHLAWVERETGAGFRPRYQLFIDGRPSLAFEESFEFVPASWEISPDGVLQFLATAGEVVKRYRVTASDDTTVETMARDFAANETAAVAAAERGRAEADAAKAKAQEDAAAAQAKAQADAQAANAAKVKAREEAVAAKKKAREDALAAKQKAREDALAERQRSK